MVLNSIIFFQIFFFEFHFSWDGWSVLTTIQTLDFTLAANISKVWLTKTYFSEPLSDESVANAHSYYVECLDKML